MMSLKPYVTLQQYDPVETYTDENNNSVKVHTLYVGVSVLVPDGFILRLRKPFSKSPDNRQTCVIYLELFSARTQRYYGPQSFLLSLSTRPHQEVINIVTNARNRARNGSVLENIKPMEVWPGLNQVEVIVGYRTSKENELLALSGDYFNDNIMDLSQMNTVGKTIISFNSEDKTTIGLLTQEPGLGEDGKSMVLDPEPFPVEELIRRQKKKIKRVVGPDTPPDPPTGPPFSDGDQ